MTIEDGDMPALIRAARGELKNAHPELLVVCIKAGALKRLVDFVECASTLIGEHEPRWSAEWPTEPGWYWFYGARSAYAAKNGQVELRPCAVRKSANGVLYVMDGAFMYRAEGGAGLWSPIAEPAKPPLTGVVE